MKKLFLFLLFCITSTLSAFAAGSYTTVTITLTDGSSQVWANAFWSVTLQPPYGNPNLPTNNGTTILGPQSGFADGSGTFTVTLDDNSVVTPSGSRQAFIICPNATVGSCTKSIQFVHGASQNLSASVSADLMPITVNAAPTIFRAYQDTQVNGGYGAIYLNTTNNHMRVCFATCFFNTNWNDIFSAIPNPIVWQNGDTLTAPNGPWNWSFPAFSGTICIRGDGVCALLISPNFTGSPTAPTPATADNSTLLATTAFVKNQNYITALTAPVTSVFSRTGAVVANSGDYSVGQVTGAAPIASPTFTGVPAAPTASPGTNTTQLATTAFVTSAIGSTGKTLLSHIYVALGVDATITSGATTTILSQVVTMPSSGCPCRIMGLYGIAFTNTNAGVLGTNFFDGTNPFGSNEFGVAGSFTGGAGFNGSAVTQGTFANNAAPTIILRMNQNTGANVIVKANPATIGEGTWMELEVVTSN